MSSLERVVSESSRCADYLSLHKLQMPSHPVLTSPSSPPTDTVHCSSESCVAPKAMRATNVTASRNNVLMLAVDVLRWSSSSRYDGDTSDTPGYISTARA